MADCGLVYMQQNKIRQNYSLPRPNNNRDIKTLNNDPSFNFIPILSFLKSALLEELVKHSLIFYFLWYKPDIIQKYVFEQNSSEECSKIINFFAFYQGLPIFLTVKGLLQIEPNLSKEVFFPLSVLESLVIYATYCIKSSNENRPIAAIIIISIHSFSIIFKFLAYFYG